MLCVFKAKEMLSLKFPSWQEKCSDITKVPDAVVNMIEGLSVTPEQSPTIGYCNGVSVIWSRWNQRPQFPFLLLGVLHRFRRYSSHCQIKAVGSRTQRVLYLISLRFLLQQSSHLCVKWLLIAHICYHRPCNLVNLSNWGVLGSVQDRVLVNQTRTCQVMLSHIADTCVFVCSSPNSSIQKNLDSLVPPPAPPIKAQISPLANMFNPEPRSPLNSPFDRNSGTPQMSFRQHPPSSQNITFDG